MRYFIVSGTGDDALDRWYLNYPVRENGSYVSPWIFTEGRRLRLRSPLLIRKYQEGRSIPLSFAAFEIPVVTAHGRSAFESTAPADVQFIPVRVEGEDEPFWIMNVTSTFDCVDEARSRFDRYSSDDRVELRDRYKTFYRLKIDPTRTNEAQLLRPKGWEGTLIVSETVRETLVRERFPSLVFKEV